MATYWKKTPEKPTQNWQILRREAGKSKAEKSDALEAINLLWRAGKLDREQAERRVNALVLTLQKASKANLADQSLVNRKLMEDYWQSEYETRILVDADAMYNDLLRAIKAIEPVDLVSATRAELQAKVNKLLPNRGKQRRVVARINQLLRYLGREVKLQAAKKPRPEISYLNEADLLKVLPKLPTFTRLFAGAMFYTGARPGEMFRMFIKGPQVIRIPDQLNRKKEVQDTKTGQGRDVLVEPKGWKYVEDFIKYRDSIKDKEKLPRNARHATFKKETSVVIYDLRHSYAIHMLNKGLSMSDIALLLGNSVAVCNEYYLGFVAKPETIEAMKQRLKTQETPPQPEPGGEKVKGSRPGTRRVKHRRLSQR
jgi:integrase